TPALSSGSVQPELAGTAPATRSGALPATATAPLVEAPAVVPATPPTNEAASPQATPGGKLLQLDRPQAPDRSAASRKLDSKLDRLPEQPRGTVSRLPPKPALTAAPPP